MSALERIGRYRVTGELGRGAMGAVYRGRDESLDRDVALKVMSQGLADADARARFRREAQAAARLQHPNIVVIYEFGEHDGAPYMALELLDGVDLQRAIGGGLRPDPRSTLPLVLQLLSGLAHAHEHGIVHRDVKPSNLFLPLGRPAKIMDFGVARLSGLGTTTSGTIVGTPNYMSPEQVSGGELDGRSDLFSAGLILYELVTGEKAIRADTVVAAMYKILHESPDLSLIPPGAQWRRLRELLERALAHRPDERFPDARAMAAELALALADLGGIVDWTAPSDQALLVAPKPRPVSQPAPTPGATLPRAASGAARSPGGSRTPPAVAATAPEPLRPPHLWLSLAAAGLLVACAGGAFLLLRSRARVVAASPARALAAAPATSGALVPTPAAVAPVAPVGRTAPPARSAPHGGGATAAAPGEIVGVGIVARAAEPGATPRGRAGGRESRRRTRRRRPARPRTRARRGAALGRGAGRGAGGARGAADQPRRERAGAAGGSRARGRGLPAQARARRCAAVTASARSTSCGAAFSCARTTPACCCSTARRCRSSAIALGCGCGRHWPAAPSQGGSSMAYVIAEPCIDTKDTACVEVCPVDCIHPKKDEPDSGRRRSSTSTPRPASTAARACRCVRSRRSSRRRSCRRSGRSSPRSTPTGTRTRSSRRTGRASSTPPLRRADARRRM